MSDIEFILVTIICICYILFGAIIAVADISNKEIVLPSDLRSDGFNLFGSWFVFICRSLLALPFWILFTIIYLVYRLIMWLFTVGGTGHGSN